MLINKNVHGYQRKKRYITGRGFVDAMSSIFNSLKTSVAPALRSVGTYVSTNRDLIAKPVLGAVGSLAATGLTAGIPALISRIASRNKTKPQIPDDPKYKEILQSMMTTPVTNIIGSGVHRGAGIKTF